jgi:hypothetical protein
MALYRYKEERKEIIRENKERGDSSDLISGPFSKGS